MKVTYNVIKEEKMGDVEGEVIASFSTGREAEEAATKAQQEDDTNRFNYFVQTVKADF